MTDCSHNFGIFMSRTDATSVIQGLLSRICSWPAQGATPGNVSSLGPCLSLSTVSLKGHSFWPYHHCIALPRIQVFLVQSVSHPAVIKNGTKIPGPGWVGGWWWGEGLYQMPHCHNQNDFTWFILQFRSTAHSMFAVSVSSMEGITRQYPPS